ncbi:MAG: SirB2 family protein [Gammaproteobacteria bacterium]|nr:SirB2 family protein [Gammaproteobacteria bacterium]
MYTALKSIHLTCAVLSICGYLLRGWWMLRESPLLNHRLTRILPHTVDAIFLGSGIWLAILLRYLPHQQPWFAAKLLGILAYILLGLVALRRGRTKTIRATTWIASLACFAYVVGAARTKSVASWLSLWP